MPRILLVDDDIAEISAVKRVLARAGHQPVLATNASDALAAITQEKPALLIVSAACESGDALTLARRLNDDLDTAGIPLLVLGEAAAIPDGARRLPRPVDPEQLSSEVKAALDADPAPAHPATLPATAPAPARGQRPAPGVPLGRVQPARSAVPLAEAAGQAVAPHPAAEPTPAAPAPRRTGPEAAAAARRVAADALRARAEELRRKAASGGAGLPAPAARLPRPEPAQQPAPRQPAPAPEELPGALELEAGPTAGRDQAPAAPAPEPPSPGPVPEEAPATGQAAAVEARQRAADEALSALEEEAGVHVAEVMRARAAQVERPAAPDPAAAAQARQAEEAERRGEEEARLRASIEAARREAFEAARSELEERARREAAEAARLAQLDARAHHEAIAAAQKEAEELVRREAEAARRHAEAEERVRAEAGARRRAEEELGVLRSQLLEERRKAEERVATVMQRAAAEEEAAEELRQLAEDETRQREEQTERARGEEEQKLRTAFASAQAELEILRGRSEEEARRRAEAEAALQRAEAARREEQALREEQFRRQEQALREGQLRRQEQALLEDQRQREEQLAPAAVASFDHPDFFAPFDGAEAAAGPEPLADPAEEAARRRVAALRGQAEPDPEPPMRAPDPIPAAPEQAAAEAEPGEPPDPVKAPPLQLRAGDLADLPAPRLFALAARARLEGRLDFQGEVARSIWFEDGRVVGATSAEPSERVDEVALRLGLITRDQHRRMAQAAATLPSRRAALLLLERGFLKASELTGLVRRRTEEVVFGVFADEDGRFRWSGVAVPPEERAALEHGTLALAVDGVRRRWLAPRLDALLGGPATLLVPVQGGPAPAELGLSTEERRLVALADGLRTLDELVAASPLDALSSRQVLAALVLTGGLTVRLVQGGRPAAQAAAAIDLARVKDKLEQVRRADYFTVLGVGRHGTPHEVREAADRLQGEFDPRRFAGVADEGLPARLAEILQVVQDAREVLADERLRDEYLRGLGDGG